MQITIEDNSVVIVTDDAARIEYARVGQPAPPPVSTSPIIKGGFFDGIADDKVPLYAADFGMTWARVWMGISDYAVPPGKFSAVFEQCRRLKAAGMKVLLVCTPIEARNSQSGTAYPVAPSDPGKVSTFFHTAAVNAAGCVDAWEVMNEPNLSNYNADYGRLAVTVSNVLKPAYEALHALGQFVVGASWSGDASGDNYRYFIAKGYLATCDAVGYHPYGSNSDIQLNRVAAVRNTIGDKPLWITEWWLHNMDVSNGPRELYESAQAIKPLVQAVFQFKLVKNDSPAGRFAPYDTNLQRLQPWYDAAVGAMGQF